MAGRPKIYKEEEVLGEALELFWRKGYESTSTEDLLQGMRLNKGSLYHNFGSKKELFVKTMDFFSVRAAQDMRKKIAAYDNPIEGIRQFFLGLADSDQATHQKGCFMGNSLAELANVDHDLKQRAKVHLEAMENMFLKVLREAKRAGTLKTKETPENLARYLLNLWNGINITRRIHPRKEMLEPIIRMQLSVLE